MKKTIILLILVFSSCNKKTSENHNLEGNWSFVDIDSTYSEIRIQNDTIITYNEHMSFLPLKSFSIKDDSIFINESRNKKLNTIGFLLSSKDKNSYYLSSDKMKGKILLKKIDSSMYTLDKLKNLKENLRFKVDFENRKNEILGISKRHSYSDTL